MDRHGAAGVERADGHVDGLTHGVEDHGRLADGAADAEHDARGDAPEGGRQHDAAHDLPLGGAQAVGAPADVAGHGANGLLGGTHDDGQHEQRQGHGGREHGEPQTHGLDEQGVTEQAHDDRGDGGERVGSVADDVHQAALLGVLGQVDGGEHGDGRADEHGERRHVDGRHDGGPNAALGVDALGPAEDEVERDVRQAVDHHVGDDGDEHERGDGGSHAEHAEHDGVARVLGDALGLTVGERALDALGGRDLLGLSAVGDAAALHVGIV